MIPVNVFTGFLGAGKTTIILNLVSEFPKDYKCVLLKNEFGNIKVDSELAKEKNLEVTEFINGCLCCVLIGKLGDAIDELIESYGPDRILIETSGSAYPAPIAWEIRKKDDVLDLDSIVTVIDAINFKGYKDKSFTAKLQAKETDLILINKHELVSESELESVLDEVYELNPTTPKIKTNKGKISPDLIFGIDTTLFSKTDSVEIDKSKVISSNPIENHHNEVEIIEIITKKEFKRSDFEKFLVSLKPSDFYRIKGMVKFENGFYLLNYVFGKFDFIKLQKYKDTTKIVFMGREFSGHIDEIGAKLDIDKNEIKLLEYKHEE